MPDARYNRGAIVRVNSRVIVRVAKRFTSLLQGKGMCGFYSVFFLFSVGAVSCA